ncbi:hypothetical protein [Sphingopyxis sp.]|uniref:hypothetical protein n=1 Tax=Sphingopyxis sp. TaxID=1908224 RepID=UPI001D1B7FCA|nr:hypothetical protein [Sphingopyxis sp.]MBW8296511.1 hypothetical protein [Sphingopyxis sp.]
MGGQRRLGRSIVIGCVVVAIGILLIWGRALWVAAPVLAAAAADIVISDRWLPREGVGRWMTIGRDSLPETCGFALYLGDRPTAVAMLRAGDAHP